MIMRNDSRVRLLKEKVWHWESRLTKRIVFENNKEYTLNEEDSSRSSSSHKTNIILFMTLKVIKMFNDLNKNSVLNKSQFWISNELFDNIS